MNGKGGKIFVFHFFHYFFLFLAGKQKIFLFQNCPMRASLFPRTNKTKLFFFFIFHFSHHRWSPSSATPPSCLHLHCSRAEPAIMLLGVAAILSPPSLCRLCSPSSPSPALPSFSSCSSLLLSAPLPPSSLLALAHTSFLVALT